MLAFFIFVTVCCATADPLLSGNPEEQGGTVTPTNNGTVASGAVRFFQQYISPIDGDRCPMYPSCSAYSREVFEQHGLLLGWIMTCDRLQRCGRDEWQVAPRVVINGRLNCYDPVEHNDFWWTEKK